MERPAPYVTPRTIEYWKSGKDGMLRIARCGDCGFYIHPPMPICPRCHGRDIAFQPVSGKGTVHSFTINRYQWKPGMPPPYVLASVELEEQDGLAIMTNIMGCEPEDVTIGMAVSVRFEEVEDCWIPVFYP